MVTQRTNNTTSAFTLYEYDAENKLIRVVREDGSIVNYKYDGLGRRIEKEVDSVVTQYIYDNEDILLELDGSNNIVARYTHGQGADEPLTVEKNGVSSFYHADGLGSITELTDTAGTIAQSYTYSSFGKIESQLDPNFIQPYAFTAREFDPETAFYYYRARYYSSRAGRFLSEDPAGFNGGVNFYSYVGNTPVNVTDPFGLYGTNSCDYYVGRCNEDSGAYYCIFAQLFCNVFPTPDDPDPSRDDDFEGFNRCTRQCLQDCDEKGIPTELDDKPQLCELKESSEENQRGGDPVTCHKRCFSICGSGKNPQF